MNKLYTIGYEGANVDQLIETLVNLNVKLLADVRELPLSRKKGLSKNALNEKLNEAGIEYRHYKKLGDPKPGRDAAKSGDFVTFERIFYEHMSKPGTREALSDLLKVASTKLTCMMCFERCATHCHRSIIADEAIEAGFEVFNLIADRPEKYLLNDFSIPRHNPRESLTAAE
ncbi:DUF488 domain-containing protein [Loktanella sp. S4079]|uniref:DUF488 domain-containing protein n=1 Tax=Loktanella sp. S4079 TaxID=579483 RepID=UPI0005FA7EDD|nr:DUF488 domain-containing protein [Loktanella sp. S4079]KJZ19606.1 hypothetical protein TW80_01485 [Loktanella sp. S4079]